MTRIKILGITLSIVWFLIVFVIALNETYSDDDFYTALILYGVIPLVILWGIAFAGRKSPKNKDHQE